jgi:hypothetical protein
MLTESTPVFVNNLNQELQSTQLSIYNEYTTQAPS